MSAETDQLTQLAQDVVSSLQQNQLLLSTAESCTGGWLGKAITDISGSSAVYDRGFITYSNDAKQEMLAVEQHALLQHGAVSEEVVTQMAAGAVHKSHAETAISTSGIAGPGGGTDEKPVGTVCFGWQVERDCWSTTAHFDGDRDKVRYQACCFALKQFLTYL